MSYEHFKAWIKPTWEKIENILKFGRYTRVNSANGKLQEIQIKNIRNLDECLKMGQFGFNSNAPIGSRAIVGKIGNDKIVIANEHIASIIDVPSGDTIIYNESGNYVKIAGDTITTSAPKIINNCENFTVNASVKTTFSTPLAEFTNNVNVNVLLSAGQYSGLNGTAVLTNQIIRSTQDIVAGYSTTNISLLSHTHLQNDGNDFGGGVDTDSPTSI